MSYAQTNVQLYNQLRSAAWADDDLRHVQCAYRLAMRVVAGHYRPNEKPSLAHLIGVASILASCGSPSTIVSAGLLQSVYQHGEFGDGSRGMNEDKRREVRRAVGAACEELVARCASFPWSAKRLQLLSARARELSPVDAAVALLKLADTLEDYRESGLQYAAVEPLAGTADEWLDAAVGLSRTLGHVRLAGELAQLRGAGEGRVPGFLQTDHGAAFAVAPMSHGLRASVRLSMLYRMLRDRVLASRILGRTAA